MMKTRPLVLVVLLAALGCKQKDNTGIVVEVSTNCDIPTDIEAFEIKVTGRGPRPVPEVRFELVGPSKVTLPAQLGLAPDDPPPEGPLTIEAIGLRGGEAVISKRAVVSFWKDHVVLLQLALLKECLGMIKACSANQTCEQTVDGPRCVNAERPPQTLPPFTPQPMPGPMQPPPGPGPDPDPGPGPTPDGPSNGPTDAGPGRDMAPPRDMRPGGTGGAGGAGGTGGAGGSRPDMRPAPDVAPEAPAPVDVPAEVAPEAPALRALGEACMAPGDCASGFCADGVCCNRACADRCTACSAAKTGGANGMCLAIPAGNDPDDDCPVDPAAFCQSDGTCNGVGACRQPPAGTTCRAASCMGNTYQPASTCNSLAACIDAPPMSCGLYACGASGCFTACTGHDQCAVNAFCTGGSCETKRGLGAVCTTGVECLSGRCVALICA